MDSLAIYDREKLEYLLHLRRSVGWSFVCMRMTVGEQEEHIVKLLHCVLSVVEESER